MEALVRLTCTVSVPSSGGRVTFEGSHAARARAAKALIAMKMRRIMLSGKRDVGGGRTDLRAGAHGEQRLSANKLSPRRVRSKHLVSVSVNRRAICPWRGKTPPRHAEARGGAASYVI